MYLDVQGEICCLKVFVSIFTYFLVSLCPDDGPSWTRNWSQLNKYIHKIVLVEMGDI
jgi:hypothetical protein